MLRGSARQKPQLPEAGLATSRHPPRATGATGSTPRSCPCGQACEPKGSTPVWFTHGEVERPSRGQQGRAPHSARHPTPPGTKAPQPVPGAWFSYVLQLGASCQPRRPPANAMVVWTEYTSFQAPSVIVCMTMTGRVSGGGVLQGPLN